MSDIYLQVIVLIAILQCYTMALIAIAIIMENTDE
ncbi:MAG: hypothetical protein BWY63_01329 [Chloroflexi bacterium ADurb.Bin360]|nr:MAG: hypothetical protein BWY63_01329 [Chloroflexi bacterium ADurb.Bin360]